jgi:hypothetical protein
LTAGHAIDRPSGDPGGVRGLCCDDRLQCNFSIAAYCAGNHCDRTLDEADHDDALRYDTSRSTCGDLVIIEHTTGFDVTDLYYYRTGMLEAIEHIVEEGEPQVHTCTAGPIAYDPPRCP